MKNLIGIVILLTQSTVVFGQEIPFDPNEQPAGGSFSVAPQEEQPSNPNPYKPQSAAPQVDTKSAKAVSPGELGALGSLAPFSDVAVIQKRFLPKTGRFELYPNFGLILNDAFFTNTIMGGRIAYYFKERYGVEAMGLVLGTSNKEVTNRLGDQTKGLGVQTRSLVSPQAFYGLSFKWVPIYGKFGFFDDNIVPFDMYFSLGGGLTKTNQDSSPPTLMVGTGQMFAIKKWLAFRWDITSFWYKSDSGVSDRRPGGIYNNLHATIGMSLFFPGAEYR